METNQGMTGMTAGQKKLKRQPVEPERLERWKTLMIVGVFCLTVAGLIGYPYYKVYVRPWRQVVLEIVDTKFDMGYCFKRMRVYLKGQQKYSFDDATRVIQDIQNRELIKQEAEKRKLEVSDDAVAAAVRRSVLAFADSNQAFEEIYRTMLGELGLAEADFHEILRSDLLRKKLLEDIQLQLPRTAEQVHVYAIVVKTSQEAEEISAILRGGGEFSVIAGEKSIDLTSAAREGELGWFPWGTHDLVAIGQVHARGILSRTKQEAEQIRERILNGENFEAIAGEVSTDEASRGRGGYLGWVSTEYPGGRQFAAESYDLEPGGLSRPIDTAEGFWVIELIEKSPGGKVIDDIAFQMAPGQVSPPLYTNRGFYLLKVAARETGRALEKRQMSLLAERALEEWLIETARRGSQEGWIKWRWGSESFDWLMSQLN
jgi:parvulin-like peptidyl-prolyl isomerase